MRDDPGDELQVVHRLHLSGLFPIPVADLAFPFIQGKAFQREQRPDHVFAHPLGLFLGLCPDPTMDIKPRVPPGENPLAPFRAQEFVADKIGQDLASGRR
jgi:hypothetical protein